MALFSRSRAVARRCDEVIATITTGNTGNEPTSVHQCSLSRMRRGGIHVETHYGCVIVGFEDSCVSCFISQVQFTARQRSLLLQPVVGEYNDTYLRNGNPKSSGWKKATRKGHFRLENSYINRKYARLCNGNRMKLQTR
ncbi:hypothetical protein J6590_005572 [Homalodisca vitripennis]|nr:hypothetical protein J6590_005572 [Homalodisca vitripennis]